MKTTPLKCSFCNKVQEDVRKLISGPGDVYICDECIGICNEILIENDIRWNDRGVTPATDKHAKADEHLRAVEALIAAGEYKSAARLIRSSALYAISGLLDLAGEGARRIAHQARMAAIRDDDEPAGPDTYGWSAVALIRAVLHFYPNTQPMLQTMDRSHVILQLSLDGATIVRDDAEHAFRALRDLVDLLEHQIDFATTTPRVGLPRPPGA